MLNSRVQTAILLGGPALLAAGLVCWGTSRYGVGLSPDSIGYLGTARSLLDGRGFVNHAGIPFTAWPPLYPALLAAGGAELPAARLLGLAAIAGIVLAGGSWALAATRSRPLALLCALSLATSVSLLSVSSMAWSEPVFILLALLSLRALAAERHGAAAAATAVACVTRYAGVVLLPILLCRVLTAGGDPLRRRILRAVLATALAALPLAAWLLRNVAVTGRPGGERFPSAQGLLDNVAAVGRAFGTRLVSRSAGESVPGVVSFLALAALFAFALAVARRRLAIDRRDPPGTLVLLCAAFGMLSVVFLVALASVFGITELGTRLLSPAFAALLLAVLVAGWSEARRLREAGVRTATAVALVLAIVFASTSGARAFGRMRKSARKGAGSYHRALFMESAIVRRLRSAPPAAGPVFSNNPPGVYLVTGRPALKSPQRTAHRSRLDIRAAEIDRMRGAVADAGTATLVWFAMGRDEESVSPAELAAAFHLTPLVTESDGAIYRVAPR